MLDLNELATGRIPAITPALGSSFAEAAGVCLESQGHRNGVTIQVNGPGEGRYTLEWPSVTEQAKRAWNDDRTATEWGAAGIAALLADQFLPYTPIEVSRQGTGFDFWLGPEPGLPFQVKGFMEVSGIRRGNVTMVRRRVREKLVQITRSLELNLTGYVAVVEFGTPMVEVHQS